MALRIRSLVYWNVSLSVPFLPPPSLYSGFIPSLPVIDVVVVRFPALLSPSLAQFFGVLPSTRSSQPNEFASRRPLRFHLPLCSLLRCFLSVYLCSSAIALSATQRPSVAYTKLTGFYYEIRDSPGLVQVYPYLPTPFPSPCSPDTTPSRYILANFANVGSCRITHLRQYRPFLRICRAGVTLISRKRDIHSYYFSRFYRNESLAEILTLSVMKILQTGHLSKLSDALSITNSLANLEWIFIANILRH